MIGDGPDADDVATAAMTHLGEKCVHEPEGSDEVYGQRVGEIGVVDVLDAREVEETGAVDENIWSCAEPLTDCEGSTLHVGAVAEIAAYRIRRVVATKLASARFELACVSCEHRCARARADKDARDGEADPA